LQQQQSWLFVSGFGCCISPHHYTTTIKSLTHSLTHSSATSFGFGFGVFFLVCWVFFFCLVLFVITATSRQNKQSSKQASKQNKQSSKQACKTNNQASKQANKQVIKQSNSTAASNLSSTEPITRFFFYPFSSLQCSVPDFCEDLSKPHFS